MTSTDKRHGLAALALGALGVVYGDIGTSPLYTMKEVFNPANGIALDRDGIVGAVSVIFWALMVVVTLKYVILILRADNHGEGGIMALTALAANGRPGLRHTLLLTGVLGAALFYGDSVITPAISVLSAVEGLEVITPAFKPWVMPIALVIIVALFLAQRFGTATVGKLFGPIITVWFVLLAVVGLIHVVGQPAILAALDPLEAARFIAARGWHLFVVMGSIVLALTGAEALYADMGHFGRQPIRIAWTALVLPSLALNYMGQGALLMGDASALESPFYRMFPPMLLVPMVLLATAASVIASQAVISGAYSMTKQAIQLGLLPRMRILNTSEQEAGQIYVPMVNWTLMGAVLLATLGFESSSALASAYGIAVTVTMFITTVLTFFVVRYVWRFSLALALAATLLFGIVDAVLVASCSLKIVQGGWFPLVMGAVIFTVMATWKRGREILVAHVLADDPELLPFVQALAQDHDTPRIGRTAVYAVANPDTVPQAMLHNMKHYQVLHENNVILHVKFMELPRVPADERIVVESLAPGFWRVQLRYGFMDQPDIPMALASCSMDGLVIDQGAVSYFLSRAIVVPSKGPGMALWRESLFATMSRNAGSMADYFRLPHNCVVELGTRVQI